jgi:hypothetical protein
MADPYLDEWKEMADPYLDEWKNKLKVSFNEQERKVIMEAQSLLRQPKPTTALKQLAFIGYAKLALAPEIYQVIAENVRKNTRWGICEIDKEIENSWRKVPR